MVAACGSVAGSNKGGRGGEEEVFRGKNGVLGAFLSCGLLCGRFIEVRCAVGAKKAKKTTRNIDLFM